MLVVLCIFHRIDKINVYSVQLFHCFHYSHVALFSLTRRVEIHVCDLFYEQTNKQKLQTKKLKTRRTSKKRQRGEHVEDVKQTGNKPIFRPHGFISDCYCLYYICTCSFHDNFCYSFSYKTAPYVSDYLYCDVTSF